METFTKVYNKRHSSARRKTEINCLKLLKDNTVCICGNNCHHFPEIIEYNDDELILTHCGMELKEYKNTYDERNELFRDSEGNILPIVEQQIDCIIHNLKQNNIKHWDIHDKNILYLIDFDLSLINNKLPKEHQTQHKLNQYKRRYRYHLNGEYYVNLKRVLKEAIMCSLSGKKETYAPCGYYKDSDNAIGWPHWYYPHSNPRK